MRIVGGKYKGRIFRPDKNFAARPTTDIAKEALFNILVNRYDFTGLRILDLFSGTGSIGYEFVSRGAEHVTFIEKKYSHIKFIYSVIEKLEISNSLIVRADVFKYINKCINKFDIIFCDPPYDLQRIDELPGIIFQSGIITNNGLLIIEHSKNNDFSNEPNFTELRKYGKVNFSFFVNSV